MSLRIGLAGSGWWAQEVHVPAFQKAGATLVGVYATNIETGKSLARDIDCSFFSDYEELLKQVDAVSIAATDDAHSPLAIAAAKRSKGIFIEKPLGLTLKEAEAIQQAVLSNEVIAMTALTLRGDPYAIEMQRLIKENAIGEIMYLSIAFNNDFIADPNKPTSWRAKADKGGKAGVVADLGPHVFDLIRFVTGKEITSLFASGNIHFDRAGSVTNPDEVSMLMKLGKINCLCSMSRVHTGSAGLLFEVQGTKGALKVHWSIHEPGEGLSMATRPGQYQCIIPPEPSLNYHYGKAQIGRLVKKFVHAFENHNSEVTPGITEGLIVQQLIEATCNSLESGTWVSIDNLINKK